MTFLTGHMEAMLAAATDPQEIELRRGVLDDHVAAQLEIAEKRAAAEAVVVATDDVYNDAAALDEADAKGDE